MTVLDSTIPTGTSNSARFWSHRRPRWLLRVHAAGVSSSRRGGWCGPRGRRHATRALTISTVTRAGEHTETSDRPELAIAQARWFRALADPTRLAIIKHLLAGPRTVTELVDMTGLPQSRISNHLACLRWCRFVHTDRQGRHVIYSIADTRLKQVLDLADDLVADHSEHLATCKRIGPDWI